MVGSLHPWNMPTWVRAQVLGLEWAVLRCGRPQRTLILCNIGRQETKAKQEAVKFYCSDGSSLYCASSESFYWTRHPASTGTPSTHACILICSPESLHTCRAEQGVVSRVGGRDLGGMFSLATWRDQLHLMKCDETGA